MASQVDDNPERVKNVYDYFRTAKMNLDYYGCRLVSIKRVNRVYEIVLAAGTSGTVAGFYVWQTPPGKTAWTIFGGLVALLAVLKPILKIPQEVERYSTLHAGYSNLYYDLKHLVEEIKASGGIAPEMRESIEKARARFRELGVSDDPKPSAKLLAECQEAVKRSVPSFKEWWPRQTA